MKKLLIYCLLILSFTFALSAEVRIDTLKPKINISGTCGDYTVRVTELVREYDKDTVQYDTGVSIFPQLDKESENIAQFIIPDNFNIGLPNYDFTFQIKVKDKFKYAKAIFFVRDNANPPNIKYDSIEYKPQSLYFLPTTGIDFGDVTIGDIIDTTIRIHNNVNYDILIKSIEIEDNPNIIIDNDIIYKDILLDATSLEGEGIKIPIKFIPCNDTPSGNEYSVPIIIKTECLEYKYIIRGRCVVPIMEANNLDFGITVNHRTAFLQPPNMLIIKNTGTGILKITDFNFKNDFGFIIDKSNIRFDNKPVNQDNPIIIPPDSTYKIFQIKFDATTPGEFIDTLIIDNNEPVYNNVIQARVIVVEPGPYTNNLDFDSVRIGATVRKYLFIKNSADYEIFIKKIELNGNNNDFKIIYDEIEPPLVKPPEPPFTNILLYPEAMSSDTSLTTYISVPIEFTPSMEFDINEQIHIHYELEDKKIINFAYLKGFGYLPKIKVNSYIFEGETMVGNIHPEQGVITITSMSESSDLTIYGIRIDDTNVNHPNDFILQNFPLPIDDDGNTIPIKLKYNETYEIKADFAPTSAGNKILPFIVRSDAYEGNSVNNFIEHDVYFQGNAINEILRVEDYDFGDVLACENAVGFIEIHNLLLEEEVQIDEIKLLGTDTLGFVIAPLDSLNKITISPQGIYFHPIYFHPYLVVPHNYAIEVEVKAANYSVFSEVVAATYKLPLQLGFGEETALLSTHSFVNLPLYVDSDHWNDLEITEFSISVEYNPSIMSYTNNFSIGNALPNTWNKNSHINIEEHFITLGKKVLEIKGNGPTPIYSNGIAVLPEFKLFLGDTTYTEVRITSQFYGTRDNCIIAQTETGSIKVEMCAQNLRRVRLGGYNYEILTPIPTPVYESFNLDISIGLNAPLFIGLYNSIGNISKQFYNGYGKEGIYHCPIDLNELTTGLYYLHITSGDYTEIKPILITK